MREAFVRSPSTVSSKKQLEVPQSRGVDFFSAAKIKADPLAVDAGGVYCSLVVVVSVRSKRLAVQEGESFPCGGYLCFGQLASSTRRYGSALLLEPFASSSVLLALAGASVLLRAGSFSFWSDRQPLSLRDGPLSLVQKAGHEEGVGSVLGWAVALIADWSVVLSGSALGGSEELVRAPDIVSEPWSNS